MPVHQYHNRENVTACYDIYGIQRLCAGRREEGVRAQAKAREHMFQKEAMKVKAKKMVGDEEEC